MSRAKLAAVVAVLLAAITATAYTLTTSSLEKKIKEDVKNQVSRKRDLLFQTASLESLDLMKRADGFARTPGIAAGLAQADPKQAELAVAQGIREALLNVSQKTSKDKGGEEEEKPDFLAVVNKDGQLVAIDPAGPFPTDWKTKYPTVAQSLEKRRTAKDIWQWEQATMKVGVAPVVDRTTNEVLGAVVVAYPLSAEEAAHNASLLGAQVAYFFDKRLRATSFGKSGAPEEGPIAKALFEGGLAKAAIEGKSDVREVSVNGERYMMSAAPFPLNMTDRTSGAAVMISLSDSLAPVGSVKVAILLLGLAGLVIAVLGIFLTARFMLAPAEEIELGVTEIINGNIDYTFRPAGADFDGLANALNVMLARLLGRPEPGDEEYDDQGNVIGGTARVVMSEAVEPADPKDAEALKLANEPEADYYRRIFNEYTEARKSQGDKLEGVTFESFTAKLRMNEANLKKKYEARAVRFKVVVKDGQTTLKPVPIM
jgi:hypothetical protein